MQQLRNRLVEHIRNVLIAGANAPEELVSRQPSDHHVTAILAPLNNAPSLEETADELSDSETSGSSNSFRKYQPPSSVGFSFFISGETVELAITCGASIYNYRKAGSDDLSSKKNKDSWTKSKLLDEDITLALTQEQTTRLVLEGNATLSLTSRPLTHGHIVTVTLYNHKFLSTESDYREFNENCLFEAHLSCEIVGGSLSGYPMTDRALLDDEQREIEFRYRQVKTLAVGHGAAVTWDKLTNGNWLIKSDFVPTIEIPQMTADTGDSESLVLDSRYLMTLQTQAAVIDDLENFINNYGSWIEKEKNALTDEEWQLDEKSASKIIEKQTSAVARMRKAISFLRTSATARTAFSLANQAMLSQVNQCAVSQDSTSLNELKEFKWRPFQLGFILVALESTLNQDSRDRDILDLIWFPTGGGKTEAYLGLMAILFIFRRLEYPTSGSGTVCVMRYTLRLLASQQFLRANRLICALELLRRDRPSLLGDEPFTSGFWVGASTSPNTNTEANELWTKGRYSRLVLTSCPWCDIGFTKDSYVFENGQLSFQCCNSMCDFYKNGDLPIKVVDEALYDNPPTLLLGTVDKFARLAWDGRASRFFGVDQQRPPELIIQDELHLISSSIGSVFGLYEAGIDALVRARGLTVKYVASTATIRNAHEQTRSLFARESAVFPPSGLNHKDAYFAREVPLSEKPGRLYVGILAALIAQSKSLGPIMSAALAAPIEAFAENDSDFIDAWWTLLVYHSSLKSVNNSSTVLESDVRAKLEAALKAYLQGVTDVESRERVRSVIDKRNALKTITLTSQTEPEEIPKSFARLSHRFDEDERHVDVGLASTMISVGLDVSRLALMIINGQPLTTAEYIQASSRVGRGETPGVVLVNYLKGQSRSWSHYENFRTYHESFYRFVEPSSVTPFTYQARKRALHAALVIAVRHGAPRMHENGAAGLFNINEPGIQKTLSHLKNRIFIALGSHAEARQQVQKQFEGLVAEWHDRAQNSQHSLVYFSRDRSSNNLIEPTELLNNVGRAWPTLNSMRNVESEANLCCVRQIMEHAL
ncbi:helicase-related protein [Pseudidiomarina sp. PP-1MA]|uniref:Helicase-related protein n=1 Tax=Pseudidiomarina sp. PP-1MA TaxID=3237706 RepID=A0AB39X6J3_9GAMM